jgi:sugar-phosphatase
VIKAVIFDMDGLIIDSEPLWAMAFKEAFKPLGVTVTDEDMRTVRGRRQEESIEHLYRKYNVTDQAVDTMQKQIDDDMMELIEREGQMMPGVKKTFEICQAAGLPLAIASSSATRIINTVVEKLDIRHYFDHIYSAEYEDYGKPHPGTFITAAKKLGIDPRDILVFEDAPGGVLAAKAAKMHCIAVPEPALKDHKFIQTADLVLNSLEDFDENFLTRI